MPRIWEWTDQMAVVGHRFYYPHETCNLGLLFIPSVKLNFSQRLMHLRPRNALEGSEASESQLYHVASRNPLSRSTSRQPYLIFSVVSQVKIQLRVWHLQIFPVISSRLTFSLCLRSNHIIFTPQLSIFPTSIIPYYFISCIPRKSSWVVSLHLTLSSSISSTAS